MPIDFLKCVIGFRQFSSSLKASTFFIAPNLSFDFYNIKNPSGLDLRRPDFLTEVETGFLSFSSKNQILAVKSYDERPGESIVGVWISNLPHEDKLRHPAIWSACARLILCESLIKAGINSPSSDKQTFMVATFTTDDLQATARVYEFKIV